MSNNKIIDDYLQKKRKEISDFSPVVKEGVVNSFGEFLGVMDAINNGQDPNKFFKFKNEDKNFQSYFGNTVLSPGELLKAARSFFGGDNCPDGLTPIFDAVVELFNDYKNGEFEIRTLAPKKQSFSDIEKRSVSRGSYQQPLSARFGRYAKDNRDYMNRVIKENQAAKNEAKQSPTTPKQ